MVTVVPFHCTTEPFVKLLPFTVKTKVDEPAVTDDGEIEARTGTRLLMVNVCEPDVPPPGVVLKTVMIATPAEAILVAGTEAVSCVLLK